MGIGTVHGCLVGIFPTGRTAPRGAGQETQSLGRGIEKIGK
jgi:hypothetical protein